MVTATLTLMHVSHTHTCTPGWVSPARDGMHRNHGRAFAGPGGQAPGNGPSELQLRPGADLSAARCSDGLLCRPRADSVLHSLTCYVLSPFRSLHPFSMCSHRSVLRESLSLEGSLLQRCTPVYESVF